MNQNQVLLVAMSCTVNKLHPVFCFALSINVMAEAAVFTEHLKEIKQNPRVKSTAGLRTLKAQ